MRIKDFIIQVLNAGGLGIVIPLIPIAILGTILKPFAADYALIGSFLKFATYTQSLASVLIGVLTGYFLKLNPIKAASLGIVAFLASGVLVANQSGVQLKGLGDLVNAIFMSGIAAALFIFIGSFFKSLELIFVPIISVFLGMIGHEYVLPIVKQVTQGIANGVDYFTTLSPVFMSVLVGASFALIIVSPVSSVVVAMAIQLNPVNSGIANVGIAATAATLFIGSLFVNKAGVSITLLNGIVKMMVGNLFKYPILILPIAVSGGISGLAAYFIGIQGTSFSAGFGYSGFVGPFAAYEAFANVGQADGAILKILLAYIGVAFGVSALVHFICVKVLKLYTFAIIKYEAN